MGGSFDPVHYGHLRSALEVMEALSLSEVRFIPAKVSPLKDQPHCSEQDRMNMLRLAIEGVPEFTLDKREMEREGSSYTIDTVKALYADYPNEQFVFILGVDAFNQFKQWKNWQEILALIHLVIVHRPSYTLDRSEWEEQQWLENANDLYKYQSGKLLAIPVMPLEISSTAVKQLLLQDKKIHFLVPEKVRHYIKAKKLYSHTAPTEIQSPNEK